MEFKPSKSRRLVLNRVRVLDRFRFKIGEDVIPVTEKPVKSLGKWYRDKLNDKASVKEMRRSDLPRRYKAWDYQSFRNSYGHCLCTRFRCQQLKLWKGKSTTSWGGGCLSPKYFALSACTIQGGSFSCQWRQSWRCGCSVLTSWAR